MVRYLAALLPLIFAALFLCAPSTASAGAACNGAWAAGTFIDGHVLYADCLNQNNGFLEGQITTPTAPSVTYTPGYPGSIPQTAQTGMDARVSIRQFVPPTQWASAITCGYDMTAAKTAADAAVSISTGSFTVGHGEVDWPAGQFCFAATIHQRSTVVESGASAGLPSGGSTVWKWPASTAGIVVEAANANNCAPSGSGLSGQGFTLENITMVGGGGAIDPTGAQNGITTCVMINLFNVSISGFAGDLVHVDTSLIGVADGGHIANGHFLGNAGSTRYGIYINGPDSSGWLVQGMLITNTGGGCALDLSGTGGTWIMNICESAGSNLLSYANQSGASYLCLDPFGTSNCKNTTPGTNSAIWYPITFSAGYTTYSSSTTYVAGSDYLAHGGGNKAYFLNNYCEGTGPTNDPALDVRAPAQFEHGVTGCGATSFSVVTRSAGDDAGEILSNTGYGGQVYAANGSDFTLAVTGGETTTTKTITKGENCLSSICPVWRNRFINNDRVRNDWENQDSTEMFSETTEVTSQQAGRSTTIPSAALLPRGVFIGNSDSFGDLRDVETRSAMPTTGSWATGDRVFNNNPSVLGSGGSQYTITGWIRITTGSGNVLNTDWVQMRALTGT